MMAEPDPEVLLRRNERVVLAGGTLTVDTTPGTGTEIRAGCRRSGLTSPGRHTSKGRDARSAS
jgi:hypothetical protein